MLETDMEKWLSVAKEAALLAGAFLSERTESNTKIKEEALHDIKIEADTKAERIIIDYLKGKSNFSILSEESGFLPGDEKGFTWIVDPLDGSFNYMRGIPFCCVSIGLWEDEKAILGVVYEFNRLELFSGISEKASWLNGIPLKVSNTMQEKKAVLCTGFPVNTDFSLQNIQAFAKDVSSYRKTRLFGSGALSIVYVACGRTDVYHEKDIMLWDIGGALPILLGAGGKIEMKKASKKYSYYLRASNGNL